MEQLLSAKDMCRVFGVSRATLYRMLARGEIPSPITVSLRARRWKASDISRLIEEKGNHDGP